MDKYSKHVERRDNDFERQEEGLAYRPNERDKSSIVEHLTPESTAGTLHSQRLKKLKLRLKRASGNHRYAMIFRIYLHVISFRYFNDKDILKRNSTNLSGKIILVLSSGIKSATFCLRSGIDRYELRG